MPLIIPDEPEATSEVSAPTTSTTLQMALGDALAVALLERRGFTAQEFRVLHPGGRIGAMLLTVSDLMHTGAEVPVVAPHTSMQDTLLVITEKRLPSIAARWNDASPGATTGMSSRERSAARPESLIELMQIAS